MTRSHGALTVAAGLFVACAVSLQGTRLARNADPQKLEYHSFVVNSEAETS